MGRQLVIALRATVVTLVLTGLLYPLAMTGVAQALFHGRANGSLVRDEKGNVVGSELIGQSFKRPQYLHGRPSAAGKDGYDATASGGTNLGPTSADLAKAITAAVAAAREDRPGDTGPVPADLVTSSASGFDPHLSPDAALWQAGRVARARGVPEEKVAAIIRKHIEPRTLWILGEPRVNVLLTNLDLDREIPTRP
jgi:K+-transporting ATPase ATPase C chain